MTQEEKQLLLIDLCAREPYHPRIQVFNQGYEGFQDGEFDTNLWLHHIDAFRFDRIEIFPYLRPMSSMTEEETETLWNIWENDAASEAASKMTDFLNKKHLDHHHLIDKGLALEAKEGMYK